MKHFKGNCPNYKKKLLFSFDNLMITVKWVTTINNGRNSPGLDNFLVQGKEERYRLILFIRERINIINWEPSPVKRIYIPKAKGKLRSLGIFIIVDKIV